jgi:hypothetical protein
VNTQKVLGAKFDDGSAALGGAIVLNKRVAATLESAASATQESEIVDLAADARTISIQQARLVFSQ